MAGHSKWANIKHRKGAQDAKRGKIFTKIIREITVAAKMGGGTLADNPRLRTIVDKALTANMTRDTIDRAIKRGVGSDDMANMEEIRYEGYGPSGVAVLVDCMTDNRNRTVGEVRHVFSKCGGNLGAEGSVGFLFTKRGEIDIASNAEDTVMEIALEAGADDMLVIDANALEVVTSPDQFEAVHHALRDKAFQITRAEIAFTASTTVPLGKEQAEKVLKMLEMLEDLDDVQNVYSNAEFPEDF